MANIAEGQFEIQSSDRALLDDVAHRVDQLSEHAMFSYGSMGSYPEITQSEGRLIVSFTSNWTCTAGFDWLDALMVADGMIQTPDGMEMGPYAHREALIAATVTGGGREYATLYKEVIQKSPGDPTLTRTLIDLEALGFWGMLKAAGGFDLAEGERRDNLGECLVSFHCVEKHRLNDTECEALLQQLAMSADRTVTRPLTRIQLSVGFQCQGVTCTVVLNGDGEVCHAAYSEDGGLPDDLPHDGPTDPKDSSYYGEMVEDLSTI